MGIIEELNKPRRIKKQVLKVNYGSLKDWFFIVDEGKIKATIKTGYYDAQTKNEYLLRHDKVTNNRQILSFNDLNEELKKEVLK